MTKPAGVNKTNPADTAVLSWLEQNPDGGTAEDIVRSIPARYHHEIVQMTLRRLVLKKLVFKGDERPPVWRHSAKPEFTADQNQDKSG